MDKKQPILSICIPTYNRAEILKRTLESIVTDPAFDNTVEIVISDNCSSDNTPDVASLFLKTHPNIHYYRNETNVRDKNFFIVLTRGNGLYLKLINDTVTFKEGMLQKMKEAVLHNNSNSLLLFTKLSTYVTTACVKKCDTPQDVSKFLSYDITWLSSFGIWKDKLGEICSENDDFSCQLMQSEWILRAANRMKVLMYFDDYYDVFLTNKKGSYNFFKVFTDNYFGILLNHYPWGITYEREKYRIYSKYFVPLCYNSYVLKEKFTFDYSCLLQCLFKHYWYHIYAYIYPVLYFPLRFMRDLLLKSQH